MCCRLREVVINGEKVENKKILTAIDGTVITANCMVRADTAVVTEKGGGDGKKRPASLIHSLM